MTTTTELSELQVKFLDAMGAVAAPVSIVTAFLDGQPRGSTVSAFASLSLDPPMVLVSLDERSSLLAMLRTTKKFGLNVLSTEQHGLARSFAKKSDDKFAGVDWSLERELPRLTGALGWMACEVENFVKAGDHTIVMGLVTTACTQVGKPLTYHSRAFGTHTPLELNP